MQRSVGDNTIPRKPIPHGVHNGEPARRDAPTAGTIRMVPEQVPDLQPNDTNTVPLSPGSLATVLERVEIGEDSHSPFPASELPSAYSHAPLTAEKHNYIPRSSLDKPLPYPPAEQQNGVDTHEYPPLRRKDSFRNSKQSVERELGVSGLLDLSNTEDTVVHEWISPAVVHEVIREDRHEIIHRPIEREIHEHDVFHRILPVQEVEVLPARHFVQDENGRRKEVSPKHLPERDTEYTQRLLTECFKDTLPKTKMGSKPRQFTARDFRGTEGEYGEYQIPGGPLRSDRWWVHPPTLETGGQETGQTYPFHFD